jgi:putative ABC transport system substrate-binding protein
VRRREFVTLTGGAVALGWPVVAYTQQSPMPVVGFLHLASADAYAPFMDAFRQGLSDSGYVEGRNVAIEYRWAQNDYERLPTLAAELVRQQVAVLFAGGGNAVARAARAAAPTIPVVFTSGSDHVKDGLVASLSRRGGNITGVALITNAVIAKRVELLRELLPSLATIAVFTDPTAPNSEPDLREAQEAARMLGIQILVFRASSEKRV